MYGSCVTNPSRIYMRYMYNKLNVQEMTKKAPNKVIWY